MGIRGLAQLLENNAKASIGHHEMKDLFGRKVAIDASMSIYQFMIAVRTPVSGSGAAPAAMLTNEDGEVTSHLQGIFYRTIRMIENGVKPCYVFDGKPPQMKAGELKKRSERREEADEKLKTATEEGNQEEMDKFHRRLVKVTKEHSEESMRLLQLMGIPVVQAPGEAEAQCAALCKSGKVWATATEDMDALTFGSSVLLRHMTFSAARKVPIAEYQLQKVLEELQLSMEQFIDVCILSGCDYAETIKGIGGGRALQLIRKHGNIEGVLQAIDTEKYTVPKDWNFDEARKLFKEPEILDPEQISLEWKEPDEEGVVDFLVNQKGFNMERVKSGIKKIQASKGKSSQMRLDSFFGSAASSAAATKKQKTSHSTSSGPKSRKKK